MKAINLMRTTSPKRGLWRSIHFRKPHCQLLQSRPKIWDAFAHRRFCGWSTYPVNEPIRHHEGGGWNAGATTVKAQKAETWPQHTGHTAFYTSTKQQRATGSCVFSDLPPLVRRRTGWLEHLVVWTEYGETGRKRTLGREGVLEGGVSEFKKKGDAPVQSLDLVLFYCAQIGSELSPSHCGCEIKCPCFGVVHVRAK